MIKEIKRNTWSRFCKKFNVDNQFRQATIQVKDNRQNVTVNQEVPFLGIAVTKKGRFIDSIDLFTGQYDPDKLSKPFVRINQPVRILLEKKEDGLDSCLSVESKDGTIAQIELVGQKDPQQYYTIVEKVAYSMYERRGYQPGNEVNDWLEAERKVKEVEQLLVS